MRHHAGAGLVHQASIYGSDDEFVAMAVPFIEDGLGLGEPVLVATTAANLALLRDVMGPSARDVDYAESAYFGRRPPQRVAAFHRYWSRNAEAAGDGHVRILAEPIWAGRSPAEVLAWKRMESGLNVLLSGTNIWMICPYDARVAHPAVVADARRTHPANVEGRDVHVCPEYVDPAAFAGACDAAPLPEPPADAAVLAFDGDLHAMREFVAAVAAEHGLEGEPVTLLVVAVGEVVAEVVEDGSGHATVRVWEQLGSLAVDVHDPGGPWADPFAGYHRPDPLREPEPGDRLFLARQLCDAVDVRSGDAGRTVRLQLPSSHAAEALQP
jgi:anti-sigma regulatory factor (Ser/Thr protein kinase)